MRTSNIKITVTNPQDWRVVEQQIYTNYNGYAVEDILKKIPKGSIMAPEVGNFPHVGGHDKPIKIHSITGTVSEDNVGLDIAHVIERYKDWGSPNG